MIVFKVTSNFVSFNCFTNPFSSQRTICCITCNSVLNRFFNSLF